MVAADATVPSSDSPTRMRRHKGDFMSPETRSRVMSKIRGKDTGPERAVADGLSALGLTWEPHARDLPGRPDFVFRDRKVAVFVDGDFWHGWHFPTWRDKLSPRWEEKIEANRRRDARNARRLRRSGWQVVRLWEHQVVQDLPACIARVTSRLEKAAAGAAAPGLSG